MSLISYALSETSIVFRVKILDSSVSTGAGLEALTFSSSGLIISTIADNEVSAVTYTQGGSTIETISTLGTYATPTSLKCRFKEVDATNHKGVYEIQLADARFAVSSSKSLLVSISGATNVAQTDVVIPLTTTDPYAADFGLALTNANLAHVDSNEKIALLAATQTQIGDILTDTAVIGALGVGLSAIPWNSSWDAEVQSEVDDALRALSLHLLVDTALPTNWATDITANSALDYLADDGTAVYDRTTDSLQAVRDRGDAAWDTATGFSTHNAAAVWDVTLASHTTSDTSGLLMNEWQDGGRLDVLLDAIPTTTMRGTDGAATSAKQDTMETSLGTVTKVGPTKTEMDTAHGLLATEAKQDIIDTNVDTLLTRITSTLFANMTSLAQWLGLLGGKQTGNTTARTELRATGDGSGTYDETKDSQEAIKDLGDSAWITATGFSTHTAASVFTAQMTESYAADGVAPTPAQALLLSLQRLTEFAIADKTITIKKLDGDATAATLTLDDATSPTSSTRAT